MSTPEADGRSATFRILRNAASILSGSAGGEILNSYAVAISAVALGTAGFGVLATAQAFVEPFGSLAGFGLGSVAVTVAARRGVDAPLRGTLFGLLAGFGALSAVLALIAGAITGRGGPLSLIVVTVASMALAPLQLVAMLPFQVNQTMHRVLLMPFASSVARVATAGLAYYFLRAAIGFQLSITTTSIVTVFIAFAVSARYYPTGFSFDRSLAKELLALAWPAAVLEFVVMAYMRGSYFLLHDAGPVVQGEYAAADRLVRPVLGLSAALVTSALPTVARIAVAGEFERLKGIYAKTILRCLAALLPLAGLASWGAPLLVRRFAPMYAGAATPFRVLLIGVLCMFMNQLSTTFIVAMGRFRLIMTVAMFNFVVYLALATHLIPIWGATGAAISTTVMEGINTLMQVVIVFFLLHSAAKSKEELPRAANP